MEVYITEEVLRDIEKQNLMKQYTKVEKYLQDNNLKGVDFKIRMPRSEKVYYLRLNRQFRVWCKKENNDIYIFHLDNHQ